MINPNPSLNEPPPSYPAHPLGANNLATTTPPPQIALDHLERVNNLVATLLNDSAPVEDEEITTLGASLEQLLISVSKTKSELDFLCAWLKEGLDVADDLLRCGAEGPPGDPAAHSHIERWMARAAASAKDEEVRESYAVLYEAVYGRKLQLQPSTE